MISSVVIAFGVFVLTFGLAIRVICAPFSKRIRNQIKTHPMLHFFWLYLAVLVIDAMSTLGTNYDYSFSAFDAPIVQEHNLFANYLYGNDLICLDMCTHSVRWRTKLPQPIYKIWSGVTNEIIVAHRQGISSVNNSNGQILFTMDVDGYGFWTVFGFNENGYIYYQVNRHEIACKSYKEDKEIWRFRPDMLGSYYIRPSLSEDFVFLCINPTTISLRSNAPYKERFATKGLNKLICISSSDGSKIWEEALPFSKAGFGSSLHLSSGLQYNLCVTENAIRLIEKNSGEVIKRWESMEEDIDGADFWKQDYIVLCIGGIGSRERTIRVLNIKDFSIYSEFRINAIEVESVKVVGDTLILESLYRNSGVDLLDGKKKWETGQQHYTVKEGDIFFGQHDDHYGIPFRIVGRCDPTTGSRKVLYSETAIMTGIKRQIYMMRDRCPHFFIFTIIFVLGITGIGLLKFILGKKQMQSGS